MTSPLPHSVLGALALRLSAAGFVAARDEASELAAAAGGDTATLEHLVTRRLSGEPLAWITGWARFARLDVRIDPGVYVPRPQSETLAWRAVTRLPEDGVAVDLCTGSGAVALALQQARPAARVIATDRDPKAVACARRNGVDARLGDLFEPLPLDLAAHVDVVVAVVPYVPTGMLRLLPHDTLHHEDVAHYDGGPDGTDVLAEVVRQAGLWLRPGGTLLLELGGEEAGLLRPLLEDLRYGNVEVWSDDDGDVRGIEASSAA